MSLNTPPIENTKNSKNKYVWGAIIISCILVTVWAVHFEITKANNSKNFNLNITEADKSFKMEKFVEAREYYKTALSFKADNSVQSKIQLCDDIEASYKEFNNGTDLFNKKNYLGAYTAFKKVIPQDEKRFALAKDKISESSKLYIDDEITQAKDSASTKDYQIAIKQIDAVLVFDPNNETAKTLKTQYQADLDAKLVADKAKADADAKAQELAKARAQAKADADAKALAKTQGVRIGMSKQEVLDSNWGSPEDINKTTGSWGTHEQWCYGGRNYLYFENGILTSIQN